MKILITGSSGFLGKNLVKELRDSYEVFGMSRKDGFYTNFLVDLLDNLALRRALDKIRPDCIIHCASLTNVDFCEQHPEEAIEVNVGGTKNLVNWSRDKDVKFIFISSDYVYSSGAMKDNAETCPLNVYGKTKLSAEKIVCELKNCLILRTSSVFGLDPNGKNFLMQILGLKEKRKIPSDQISNPTSISLLVSYIAEGIRNDIRGTYNAAGPESIDRYSFALKIANKFSLDASLLQGCKTLELGQVAKRPLSNRIDSSNLCQLLNINPKTLGEYLEEMKESLD